MMKLNRVLYPTDFSRCARQGLNHALWVAEQFGAELHMLHAVVMHEYDANDPDRGFPGDEELLRRLFGIAESELSGLAKEQEGRAVKIREVTRRGFSTSEVILDYVAEEDIDLIVMGTHGRRGPLAFFLGSVASDLIRSAECPILTMRELDEPRDLGAPEKILVPVDFSRFSSEALRYAAEFGSSTGAILQLLHVIEEPAYPYFYGTGGLGVAERSEGLQKEALIALDRLFNETVTEDVRHEAHALRGNPGKAIVEFADENASDLIVLPTHGMNGLERMLIGSTADKVIRTASSPVFIARAFGKSLLL